MPARWLSLRGRRQATTANTAPDKKQDFDFSFPDSNKSPPPPTPRDPKLSRKRSIIEHIRPATSHGFNDGTSKKKFRIDVPSIRPRTADGQRQQSKSRPASKSETDLIGVAFGSPGHPPMSFASHLNEATNIDSEHSLKRTGPFANAELHTSSQKWKRIGSILRPKQPSVKHKPALSVTKLESKLKSSANKSTDSLHKIQWLKSRVHLPGPVSPDPPPVPRKDFLEFFADGRKHELAKKQGAVSVKPETEPDISPSPDLKFKQGGAHPTRSSSLRRPNVEGKKQNENSPAPVPSSLLARRSRTLGQVKTGQDNNATKDRPLPVAESPPSTRPFRRLTSPTFLQPPTPINILPSTTYSPTANKYSLFPNSVGAHGKSSESLTLGGGQLKRSATSPARLSPMSEPFVYSAEKPINPKPSVTGESKANSPGIGVTLTDREVPWCSAHSFQSSISSSTTMSDIFFDIRSVRDSKGAEKDGQYVMTRPDSKQVHLARTRSKLNGATREHRQITPIQMLAVANSTASSGMPEPDGKHISVETVNTDIFDKVLDAVGRLATSSPLARAPPEVRIIAPSDSDTTIPMHASATTGNETTADSSHGKTRLEEAIGMMPSPIIEEPSPTLPDSATLELNTAIEEKETVPEEPKAEESIIVAAPTPSLDPVQDAADDHPPPVPEKDAKFVPVSKFSTSRSNSPLIGRARSPTATEILNVSRAIANVQGASSPGTTSRSESRAEPGSRSTSAVSRTPSPPVQQSIDEAIDFINKTQSSPSLAKNEGPTVTTIIHSTDGTEVSIARTVSLTRKLSSRVMVPGPKLLARRAAEEARKSTDSAVVLDEGDDEQVKLEQSPRKLEIQENRAMSPVQVVEPRRGHRPGLSMDVTVETI